MHPSPPALHAPVLVHHAVTDSQCHTSTVCQRLDGGDGVPLRLAPRLLPPRSISRPRPRSTLAQRRRTRFGRSHRSVLIS